MATFAVIKEGTVCDLVVAETKEIIEGLLNLQCVEYTSENAPHIGWLYDGTKFVDPDPVDPLPPVEGLE